MDKAFKLARQLLTMLDSEQRWFTMAEVEAALHVSDKTIRKQVEAINQQLPEAMTIETSRGKGILLQYDGRRNAVDEILADMFQETTFYRLMDILFSHEREYKLEDLAEALFMSASSLKKLIGQLNNDDLKPYKLRITYSTPMVKGNELNIRYFYWTLYSDANRFSGWPFIGIDFDLINGLITELEREKGIVYFINAKRKLTFLVAVVLQRAGKGEYVTVAEERYAWNQNMLYVPVGRLTKYLENYFSIELSRDERLFIQALFSLSQYHYLDDSSMTSVQEVAQYQGKIEYQMGHELITLLSKAYPNIEMEERLMLEVYAFFDKLLIDNAIPEWMMISTSHLTDYVEKEHGQIYQTMRTCMQAWQSQHPSVLFNNFHLTKLTLLVLSSLRYKRKKAFLVIGEVFSIRHYIANLIKKEIGDQLIINTSIMKGLTDAIVQRHQIDFVISNLPVDLESVPVVMISTVPTKRDLDNIRKELLN